MKKKKLLVGAIATALVLSTGAAAYAAELQISDRAAVQVKGEISTVTEGVRCFDETDLPEGVQYKDEISLSGGENIQTFGDTNLPEGARLVQEVSGGRIEGTNLVPSSSIGDVEGALSFGEAGLPEGVQSTGQGANSVANGVMD